MAKRAADTSGKAGVGKVYKKIEVVGVSPRSFSEAVESAVAEASKTVHGITWFEVCELRGSAEDGRIREYQATVKLGFRVDG